MGSFPFAELLLSGVSLYGVSRVFRYENSLPVVIGLLLMFASASVTLIRYFSDHNGLSGIYGLYSSMSASVGMLMIFLSFAALWSPALLKGVRLWLAIISATCLYATAGIFQVLGPLVTFSTVIAIFAVLGTACLLINAKQYWVGIYTSVTSVLFLLAGTLLDVNDFNLHSLLSGRELFYLIVALWILGGALSFKTMSDVQNKSD